MKHMVPLFLAGVATVTLVAAPGAHGQADEPGDSGSVTIVEVGTNRPVTEGDSTTVFELDLPEGASCPGDSRNDGYRYHSVFVPAGTDIGALVYNNIGPEAGNPYLPLRDAQHRPFVHKLLAPNERPGLPGLVPPDNRLTFGGWPEPGLTPGRYTAGIVCTEPTAWEVVEYWDLDQEVDIQTDPDSDVWGSTWRLVDPEGAPLVDPDTDEGSSSWVLLLVGGAVILGALFLIARRRSSTGTRQLERQP